MRLSKREVFCAAGFVKLILSRTLSIGYLSPLFVIRS